jgi:hypothetical protein
MHDGLNVSGVRAGGEARQDRSHLGLVLVCVLAEVDADRIVLEERVSEPVVELAVLLAEGSTFVLDVSRRPVLITRHGTSVADGPARRPHVQKAGRPRGAVFADPVADIEDDSVLPCARSTYVFGGSRPMLRMLPEAARRRLVDTYGAPQFSWQTLRGTGGRTSRTLRVSSAPLAPTLRAPARALGAGCGEALPGLGARHPARRAHARGCDARSRSR